MGCYQKLYFSCVPGNFLKTIALSYGTAGARDARGQTYSLCSADKSLTFTPYICWLGLTYCAGAAKRLCFFSFVIKTLYERPCTHCLWIISTFQILCIPYTHTPTHTRHTHTPYTHTHMECYNIPASSPMTLCHRSVEQTHGNELTTSANQTSGKNIIFCFCLFLGVIDIEYVCMGGKPFLNQILLSRMFAYLLVFVACWVGDPNGAIHGVMVLWYYHEHFSQNL